MKKRIAALLVLAMGFILAACGGKPAEETRAVEAAEAAETAGRVYYLNLASEADEVWQELAAAYTAQTGAAVKVVSAASDSYEDTLRAELAKAEAPTLFHCGNTKDIARWGDYCLDLTGTQAAEELTGDAGSVYDEAGALKAIGYGYETYGIIVNVDLLEAAGYTLADLTDFAALKMTADDIHARTYRLGFDAFAAPGLERSSAERFSGHLTNAALYYEWAEEGYAEPPAAIQGTSLDLLRNIWDLYITDTAVDPKILPICTADESRAQFLEGTAVFYQGGSWEYDALAVENGMKVAMIPIYMGAEGEQKAGLCSGTERFWAVNAKASQKDREATLAFLHWVMTSEEGTAMLAELGGIHPFRKAKETDNGFLRMAQQYSAEGRYTVTWEAMHATPNEESWRATVVTALAAYAAEPTEKAWTAVVETIVDGWAYEYSMEYD